MTTPPGAPACLWCGKRFAPRNDGGKVQRFCTANCRHALDAAGRRWIAAALASGALTLGELRNGSLTTRALLSVTESPPQISPAGQPAPVAPPERAGDDPEAAELLAELVGAIFGLPEKTFHAVAAALPDALTIRIDRYLDL